MRLFRLLLAAFLAFAPVAHAQNVGPGIGAVSGTQIRPGFGPSSGVTCAESQAFIARASPALGAADQTNYSNLICGLVQDGVLSSIDVFYVLAAPTSPVSVLNITAATTPLTLTGTPTFAAYQGWTGLVGANNFLTGPVLTGLIKYQRNAASLSGWENTNRSSNNGGLIANNGVQVITPFFNSGGSVKINDASGISFASATSRGWFAGVRTGSGASEAFFNAVSQGTTTVASTAIPATNPQIPQTTHTYQISFVHFGGILTQAQITAFYNRLRTYAIAVGMTP